MSCSRTFPLGLLALSVLAVLGCANPADGQPQAVVEEAVQAPSGSSSGAIFEFSEESTISFIGSKVTGSHNGGFEHFDGEINLVDGDPEKSSVRVEIDTTTLFADDERLAGHLKSPDFFDVEAHPTATFESTAITRVGDSFEITGNLDLHGVTKSITFPAGIKVTEMTVHTFAKFVINRFDFGIEYKGKADDLIRDEVVIKLNLQALRQA